MDNGVDFGSDVGSDQQNLVGESNYEVDQIQGYVNYDAYRGSSSGYEGYDSSNWYNAASSGEMTSTAAVRGVD
ncbi:hypothetical protein SOVF_074220 [Spinacia oleracea]|nr:hypothetical protein SOVF_074220 [Spinacia oleracea]